MWGLKVRGVESSRGRAHVGETVEGRDRAAPVVAVALQGRVPGEGLRAELEQRRRLLGPNLDLPPHTSVPRTTRISP